MKFQTVINAHTAWLTDIFKMGSVWNHEDRMHKNVSEKGEQTCPMVCLIKDHKGWQYSPETPVPPSRPVIAGNVGINRCISEILSLVIEPITSELGGDPIDSTGHMLDIIDQLNKSGVIKEAFTRDHEPMDIDQETTECNGSDLGCVDKEKEKENPDKVNEAAHRDVESQILLSFWSSK